MIADVQHFYIFSNLENDSNAEWKILLSQPLEEVV